MGHTQVLKGHHVLSNLVVAVTGHVSIVIISNPQWCVGKCVPNTESFAICSPGAFDLKMTRGGLSRLTKYIPFCSSLGSLLCTPCRQLLKLPCTHGRITLHSATVLVSHITMSVGTCVCVCVHAYIRIRTRAHERETETESLT